MTSQQPVCLIMGAGPGNGMAIARRFGREDFTVILMARSSTNLQSMAEELTAANITTDTLATDVGDQAMLRANLQTVITRWATPRVLVFNAVGVHPDAPSQLTPDDLLADLQIGVLGALVATQSVLPLMQAANEGSLFYTGGGAALGPATTYTTLSICKAALRNYVLSLAAELQGSPIRVGTVTIATTVRPGTQTPDDIADRFWQLHTGAIAGPEIRYPSV